MHSINWISNIPDEILDTSSPTWNKGKIHCTNAPNDDVLEAYSSQFKKNMQSFFNAREEEMAPGGLMALVFYVIPNGSLPSQCFICLHYMNFSAPHSWKWPV
ncbi:S-adenosyl-l-methionine-dependent methyltransferases superfamily protein, partial [Thalictrum thalictroides]